MKKLFTLMFALFVLVFGAKAQYLFQEGFDATTIPDGWRAVDSDADGYCWSFDYFQTTALRRDSAFASECIGCGKCEKHCPQNIPIREMLKQANKALSPWYIKPAIKGAKWFMLRGKKK